MPKCDLAEAIYKKREEAQGDGLRPHLGCSILGDACDRRLWLSFRWAQKARWSGRILRLFERGQREEQIFVHELRSLGAEVHDTDPDTGEQFRVKACGGHLGGSIDAVAIGLPPDAAKWHVLEFKTHSADSFAKLAAGVKEAHPKHYVQMQLYMWLGSMDCAYYLAVNKDTDELYIERIEWDVPFVSKQLERAEWIITQKEPPLGISLDPSWHECKHFCDLHDLCHKVGDCLPEPNCRTCCHTTPEMDGYDGRWSCAKWQKDIPTYFQKQGCDQHVYIPALLQPWTVADADDGNITYTTPEGGAITNGPEGILSKELHKAGRSIAATEAFNAAMTLFPGAEVMSNANPSD